MKTDTVILISTKESNARKICESIEGDTIEDFDNHPEIGSISPNHIIILYNSDFMDWVNNDEINLSEYFITFVNSSN